MSESFPLPAVKRRPPFVAGRVDPPVGLDGVNFFRVAVTAFADAGRGVFRLRRVETESWSECHG